MCVTLNVTPRLEFSLFSNRELAQSDGTSFAMTKKRGASAENKVMVHNQQLQNAAQEGNPSYLFPKEQPRTTGALFVSSALDAISGGFHAKAGLAPAGQF